MALLFSFFCKAQVLPQTTIQPVKDSAGKLLVTKIFIKGNKRTKNYIILREMKFREGDSIITANLYDLIEQSRALVYNTTLFSEVTVTPTLVSASELTVEVKVLEKIYIYPTPQFKLVDRNLNDWLKTYHADFNRVEYGAKFAHYNLSGRGDKLRLYLLNGYARAASFTYNAPYSNGALTEGFSVTGTYAQSRRFNYKTDYNNKSLEFNKPGFVKNMLTVGASYQRRRGFFKKNVYAVYYNYVNVNDSAITAAYNPNYFNSSKSSKGYFDFQYDYLYSKTNNVNYPLEGRIFRFTALKRGFEFKGGINMLWLNSSHIKFWNHTKNWYSSFEIIGDLKLPFHQAYINQSQIGYKDLYLRGLEYYVIDGVAAAIGKYTVKKKLVSFNIPFPFGIKKIPRLPFTIMAKAYTDAGFGYNKDEFQTKLNNRLLYTGGFGFDIIGLYDTTLRLEYSFNQLGEKGLFLHAKALF
ncbi:MAG: hypothetical protein JST81_06145 [Bacteroidetes bacterium]|nr:hypothetical protein [Bacteroidota bacterium]